jgi:hypothetical protein
MREKQMSQYSTTDLFLASFLVASKHSALRGIEDNGHGRKTFILEPPPSQEIILKFYSGEEKVSAIKLFEVFGSLKAATYTLNSGVKR